MNAPTFFDRIVIHDHPQRQFLFAAILGTALCFVDIPFRNAQGADTQSAPSKGELIASLDALYALLEKKDYAAAAKHLVTPPEFRPEMLERFVPGREISHAGIRELEKHADFGTAAERFGSERATALADRAGVSVNECYGFYHATKSETGEVMAHWNGSSFRIVRLDDVGKLSESPSPSAEPGPPTATDRLAQAQQAVQNAPNDAGLRGELAMQLFQAGDLKGSWEQLAQGRTLQPNHSGLAKGTEVLLRTFEATGLFNVGTSFDAIRTVLGDPEEEAGTPTGKRYRYAFLGLDFRDDKLHETIDLRGINASHAAPTEVISVDLDGRGWHCGIRRKTKVAATAYFFLPGEDVTKWTEQVEIERIVGGGQVGNAEQASKALIQQMTDRHPGIKHKVLSLSEADAIVAFEIPGDQRQPTRHQLVKLFVAKVDAHRIAFTIQSNASPSRELQSRWLAIFKAAKLTPTTPP